MPLLTDAYLKFQDVGSADVEGVWPLTVIGFDGAQCLLQCKVPRKLTSLFRVRNSSLCAHPGRQENQRNTYTPWVHRWFPRQARHRHLDPNLRDIPPSTPRGSSVHHRLAGEDAESLTPSAFSHSFILRIPDL